MILHNFKAYTLNQPTDTFHSMRIKDGYILEIAKKSEFLRPEPNEDIIDLKGTTVLPGFHDSHIHTLSLGNRRRVLRCEQVRCKNDFYESYRNFIAHLSSPSNSHWIIGKGLNLNLMPTNERLDIDYLDKIEPSYPLIIYTADGHSIMANSPALKIADLKDSFPSGILVDDDMSLLIKHKPKDSLEEIKEDITYAQKALLAHGITSVDEAQSTLNEVLAFNDLNNKNELKIRSNIWISGTKHMEFYLQQFSGPLRTNYLTIQSVKFFLDGAIGSEGAFTSFEQKSNCYGLELLNYEQILGQTQKVLQRQFQPVYHSIGDQASSNVLKVLNKINQTIPIEPFRPRLEHIQFLKPQDLKFFQTLPIVPSMQPCHYATDKKWLFDKFPFLQQSDFKLYPWKTVLNHNKKLAIGTDAPVELPDVFSNIKAAITKRSDQENLTLFETLQGYTVHPSWANFTENKLGKLLPNFQADLTVLSADPFNTPHSQLESIEIIDTIVDGKSMLKNYQY